MITKKKIKQKKSDIKTGSVKHETSGVLTGIILNTPL
jgi:hypothetical protein